MPELPEVETVKNGLATVLEGRTIARVETMREGLRFPFPPHIIEALEGRTIEHLSRRAKYILCTLDNKSTLLLHLGMSGKILVYPTPREKHARHDHFILWLEDNTEIAFNDARRFGIVDLVNEEELPFHPLLVHLGIEPLGSAFTSEYLFNALQKRSMSIKPALMDAKLVVGVGNIYASEALFRAGINPFRRSSSLSLHECETLVSSIIEILHDAIASGGSTLRDYVRSSGDVGLFQHHFRVYGREKEPCVQCGTAIKRDVQAGRSSFYCPQCQS
jgi:formamidopyrimidine-DNA glycosylase